MGASKAVVTRRAVLVVGGLTLLIGIEQRHGQPTAVANAGEVHPVTSGQPTASPSRSGQHTSDSPSSRPAPQPSSTPRPTPQPTHTAKTEAARLHPAKHQHHQPKKPGKPKKGRRGTASTDEPMYYVDDGRKRIALTIDDGPSPVYTPQVLALLEQYGVTATFSMIGIQVQAYPQIAREVADAGHVIANHTWTHVDLADLSSAAAGDQISRATDAIHKATGRTPRLFRAPYGAWSPAVLQRCAQARLTPVDWSVDPRDWARPGVSSIVKNIMRNTKTGSIILEHDGGGNRAETVAALKVVLPRLIDAGYRFTTP